MPLIRALIKPPDEDINAQKPKKPQHPYYKRPGKGHNHDSCDACGEGGDLICCDRCPASFHLGCYDPPLDENDIPDGLWLCKECQGSDDNNPASSRSSRAQSPIDNKSDNEKKTRSLRNNRSNSAKKKSKDEDDDIKKEPEEKEKEKDLTPMEILVRAAKIMNPRQFELPREMRIPCIFPGTEKEPGKNGNSLVTVDAWGCVPLPAKSCFVCQGTCKQAPLLQCDYCPLLFHQDCLDPPLTALPTGRWMCPNHVEQYIDWKLVNSISATERVALWEKFSGPVDQHAIKIDFIRRARKARPAFRIKVPLCVRGRVAVPDMVRHHYQNPPPLLPSRREYVRCRNVLKNLKQNECYDSSDGDDHPGKHKICMNLECPRYSVEQQYQGSEGEALRPASQEDAADDLHAISSEHNIKMPLSQTDSSSELSDSDFEYLTASVKRRRYSRSEDKSPIKRGKTERLELRPEGNVEELLAVVDEQLKKLDERLVKLLAWQRLQQLLWGEQCAGAWRHAGLSGAALTTARRGVDRARLARLGLVRRAPSELLSRADRARIAAVVWGAAPPQPAPDSPRTPDTILGTTAVRATLCHIAPHDRNGVNVSDGLGRPIPMRLSTLTVGTDSGCDVRLDASSCRRVSRNHAVIFHDEVSRHFELINYSEFGSVVNGVLFACEVHRPAPDVPACDVTDMLRDVVRHRAAEPIRINGNLTSPLPNEWWCRCPTSEVPSAGAWEGSALVPHGALLQFGCQMYVFSITDALSPAYSETSDSTDI